MKTDNAPKSDDKRLFLGNFTYIAFKSVFFYHSSSIIKVISILRCILKKYNFTLWHNFSRRRQTKTKLNILNEKVNQCISSDAHQ